MLEPITNFDEEIRFKNILAGYCALCRETGAHLQISSGMSKYGRPPKYVLIVPDIGTFEGDYFAGLPWWESGGRAFLRAHSDKEAIEKANNRLSKIISSRRATT